MNCDRMQKDFRDIFIEIGIHCDCRVIIYVERKKGYYLVKRKDYSAKGEKVSIAIENMVEIVKKDIKSGVKIKGLRYGDFKYIALYKDDLPVSADAFDKSEDVNSWKGSGFEAREISTKQYLDILNERVELYVGDYVKHGNFESDRRSNEVSVYPVCNPKVKTRMGI